MSMDTVVDVHTYRNVLARSGRSCRRTWGRVRCASGSPAQILTTSRAKNEADTVVNLGPVSHCRMLPKKDSRRGVLRFVVFEQTESVLEHMD